MADHAEHSEHVLSSGLYTLIWGILIICTFLTAWIATIDLGPFNTVVALIIATFKASIVVLIFMGVKYTHEKMTENIDLYRRIEFFETGRGHEDGYDRVFMTKRIAKGAR